MTFGIAAKITLMASALVLCMTAIIGWTYYQKALGILTDRELENLRNESQGNSFHLLSNLRQQRVDTRRTALDPEKKLALSLLQAIRANGQRQQLLIEEMQQSLQALLTKQPNYLYAAFLYRTAAADQEIVRVERSAGQLQAQRLLDPRLLTRRSPTHDYFGLPVELPPTHATSAIGFDQPPGQLAKMPILWNSHAVLPSPARGEGAPARDDPCGVIVIGMDLSYFGGSPRDRPRGLNRSPFYLDFLIDHQGRAVASPTDCGFECSPSSGGCPEAIQVADDRSTGLQSLNLKEVLAVENKGRFFKHAQLSSGKVAFWLMIGRDPSARERPEGLFPKLEQLARDNPRLRFDNPDQQGVEIRLSSPSRPEVTAAAERLRETFELLPLDQPGRMQGLRAPFHPDRSRSAGPQAPECDRRGPGGFLRGHPRLDRSRARRGQAPGIAPDRRRGGSGLPVLAGDRPAAAADHPGHPGHRRGRLRGFVAGQGPQRDRRAGPLVPIHDPAKLRQRGQALRESEARIRTILDTAAEGIFTLDADGTIESFNQAAERIFGYPASEVQGKSAGLLFAAAAEGSAAADLSLG